MDSWTQSIYTLGLNNILGMLNLIDYATIWNSEKLHSMSLFRTGMHLLKYG